MEVFIYKTSNRYSNEIISIALVGLFIATTLLVSFISGTYIPKIPLLNGHIDFWYGFAVLAILLLRDWKYQLLYIFTLPFAMAPLEIGSYAGWGDYAVELMIPIFTMVILIPTMRFDKFWASMIYLFIQLGLFTIIRIVLMTYAGVTFWGLGWGASFVYNLPNALIDLIGIMPLVLFPLIKLRKLA